MQQDKDIEPMAEPSESQDNAASVAGESPEPDAETRPSSHGPQMGYNHNVKHCGRQYHVQTEDSGAQSPHIFTHLFCTGTIIATEKTEYRELLEGPDPATAIKALMRRQHKAMMRQLIRGELDHKIVANLGSLEPQRRTGKVRRYRHRLEHVGRVYTISTSYYANVVSEVFWEGVLIACDRKDLAEKLLPGTPEIQTHAQEQHKEMLRKLRDGSLDPKIKSLLGALQPVAVSNAGVAKSALSALAQAVRADGTPSASDVAVQEATAEIYNHRLSHLGRVFLFQTRVFYGENPRAIAEVMLGDTVLTSRQLEVEDVGELRTGARTLHQNLMRELRGGGLDETIELFDELMEQDDSLLGDR